MSDEMCTSPDYYLGDKFFKERVDTETQFFNFLVKSSKNRNDRVKSIAEYKSEIAELEKNQNFEAEDEKWKEQQDQIAKLESKVADLEGKIVFFDEIVQDYAADFEGRRESRDKSDYELLSRNKRMYLNDIFITNKSIHTQKKELTELNESIAEYYHHYPARSGQNIDIDDLIVKKKTLGKEINQKTNFIQDCEMNLENLNVQLNFICPPYLETQESSNVDDKRLMAYFKVIHAKSTLTKTVAKLERVFNQLKPKLSEVEQQLNKFDKEFSFASNSFEADIDGCEANLLAMFETLSTQNDDIKRVVNDHSIFFYGCNAYSRKWTHSNLRRSILEAQKTMEEYRETSQVSRKRRPKKSGSQIVDGKERASSSQTKETLDAPQRDRYKRIRSQINNIKLGDQLMNNIHKVCSEIVQTSGNKRECDQEDQEEGEVELSSLSLSS